jgi:hypothetical protein
MPSLADGKLREMFSAFTPEAPGKAIASGRHALHCEFRNELHGFRFVESSQ